MADGLYLTPAPLPPPAPGNLHPTPAGALERYRSRFVVKHSAEDFPLFRRIEAIVSETALRCPDSPPAQRLLGLRDEHRRLRSSTSRRWAVATSERAQTHEDLIAPGLYTPAGRSLKPVRFETQP